MDNYTIGYETEYIVCDMFTGDTYEVFSTRLEAVEAITLAFPLKLRIIESTIAVEVDYKKELTSDDLPF